MRNVAIESLEPRCLLTVLVFQPVAGSFAAGAALPQAYGDRVTAAVQAGYAYGTAGDATPNVIADWGTNGKTVITRGSSFGDLLNVASTSSHSPFEMTLTADAGYRATLSGFDLAGSPSHDWTIKSIQVVDGNNAVLYSATNVKIEGDATGVRHTHLAFATPPSATKLRIRFDASNITTSGAAVGIDNIQFGQTKIAPPAPAKISGNVFNDVNRDGVKATTGETGLAGWRVFLDANNDGVFQATETSVLSDSAGNYSISAPAGTFHVAEVVQAGWLRTAPMGSYGLTVAAGQQVAGENFGDAVVFAGPVISVGHVTAVHNSTATLKLQVSDSASSAAQDIEGMTFTIQISGGTGTTPSIASVDLLTSTIWAGHNSSVFVPIGGSQAQFKTISVLTGADGVFVNANGLLATVVLDTTGAAPGDYAVELIGTKIPAFDTQFQNHVGSPVQALLFNGTLTVT